ncbi:MAG: LPS export ABC transporter permease LptF [Gammaproteobacteria bacterium]|nr:MAG: LPS export ABC transporter permease LptF [Gammaproteobacteria bacterium]RKZ95207.1 MAG: LPS export ABC transporter permease LptF [Gammaproteobacteria bacterium]
MPVLRRFYSSYFSIIDRYILRELGLNMLAVVGVLWLIFIATRFARYLNVAAVGQIPSDVIFTLLAYSSLGALSLLIPIGAFLAVMLALGRMSSDSELTVIAACGISNKRVIRNVALFSGMMAIIVAILSLSITPNALSGRYEVDQRARLVANTSGLIAGSFKESRNGDWTFYSQGLTEDKQAMENVFIEIHHQQQPLIFRAATGHFEIDVETGNKYLVLEQGYRYEGQAGKKDFKIAEYATHSLLIEKGGKKQVREHRKAMSSKSLWQRGQVQDSAELQWRSSSAVMTVILCLFAINLANAGPRKGRYAGFFPAILLYIIYSNLLGVTRAWVSKGVIAPWFGAVWVHLLMIIVLILILNRDKIRHYWRLHRQSKGMQK